MTNIFLNNLSTWIQDNYWIFIIGAIVIIALIALLVFKKKPKKITHAPIEDEQINAFVECYGGIENIQKAELDGRRLKCLLKDVDKVNIDEFKSLGATGIFISGNQIKMVLPYDMQKLVNYIESKIMEGKE